MTPEQFFKKFELFADAPGAVGKMRELIMCSAFSGALSSEERTQPMPEEWATDGAPILPAIPSSWRWQRGIDVFQVIRGVSYKKNDASDSPVDGSFPILRANNIGNGINFEDLVYIPRRNIDDEQFVRRGDILIAMSSGSKKLVGKAAPIVTEFKGAFGAFCGVIRNKSAMPDDVLARYFQSPQYTSWVTAAGRGIGINNLGRGDLDSLPIPTPSLAEQKRIVAKVDELMALCDQLEAQQQERETRHAALARASLGRFANAPTPANLNVLFHNSYAIPPADLRKSILTLAVQGKLVPQDPNDEQAKGLVERIRNERRRLVKVGKYGKLADYEPIKESARPYSIPESWAWVPLGNATLIRTGKLDANASSPDGKYPFFTCARDPLRIDRYAHDCECVLLAGNGNFDVNYYDGKFEAYQRTYIIEGVSREMIDGRYLYRFSQIYADTLRKMSIGGVISYIKIGFLTDAPFPLPPLAEQRRIVAKVDQLMTLVDQLETQLATSRTAAANLLEALVAELTGTTRERRVPAQPVAKVAPATPDHEDEDEESAATARPAKTNPAKARRAQASPTPSSPADLGTDPIATLLRERGSLTNSEAQAATGLDPATIREHLQTLVAAGQARTEGQRRGMRYLAVPTS